jgi:hypothetical protein
MSDESRRATSVDPVHRIACFFATVLLSVGCVGQSEIAPLASNPDIAARASTPSARTAPARLQTMSPAPPGPADVGCASMAEPRGPRPVPTLAPLPRPAIVGSDPTSAVAVEKAVAGLADLRSFQFSVEADGLDVLNLLPSTLDVALRGTISHENGSAMDATGVTRMREPDGSGAVSAGFRIAAGNGYVWGNDNVSGVLEPSLDQSTQSVLSVLAPEGLAGRVITPFRGGYKRAGTQRFGGVATIRYTTTKAGADGYRSAFRFNGTIVADLWIASDTGLLVGAQITGTASHLDPATGIRIEDSLRVQIDITDPNGAGNVVELPVPPIPDPTRPTRAPVDLRLEYRIIPRNGKVATRSEVDGLTVTLRTRLDVSARRVKVDVVGANTIVVTICRTTTPDADRRLIPSRGALTVVPLPAAKFGSTNMPGPQSLPVVGGKIDEDLAPVAPAASLGLTRAHVDPTTGRRGLAFMLGNAAAGIFRTYAAAHRGEYVAIVLDGRVLAVLSIDDHVANGQFAFTGDYTEAESRLLASMLYRDPLPFELEETVQVEVPSR